MLDTGDLLVFAWGGCFVDAVVSVLQSFADGGMSVIVGAWSMLFVSLQALVSVCHNTPTQNALYR